MAITPGMYEKVIHDICSMKHQNQSFREQQIRKLQLILTNLVGERSTLVMAPSVIIGGKVFEEQLVSQRRQLIAEKDDLERELRESFEIEWKLRQAKLRDELQKEFEEKLQQKLEVQQQSMQRNFCFERQKLTRQLKDYYTLEIQRLKKDLRVVNNLRVADKLLPEDEPDYEIETEQLTEPPRLNQIMIGQENNSYYFFPQSKHSECSNTERNQYLDRNHISKLIIDQHNSTCGTMRNFKISSLIETRRTALQFRRLGEDERSERRSLLGPVPQIKISLPWNDVNRLIG